MRIWDARTGEELQQLTGHLGAVVSVAYAPDGATLASGTGDTPFAGAHGAAGASR